MYTRRSKDSDRFISNDLLGDAKNNRENDDMDELAVLSKEATINANIFPEYCTQNVDVTEIASDSTSN